MPPKKKKSRLPLVLLLLLIVAAGLVIWVGLSVGPAPEVRVRTGFDPEDGELPLLGPVNQILVTVAEPRRGVGDVRVELAQGESTWTLAESSNLFRSPWKPWEAAPTAEEQIEAGVSRDDHPELQEGPATVRVTVTRSSGFLRWPEPVVAERAFTVKFTPPALSVSSTTHYVAQGGSEVVVYRVGETTERSGVQAGDWFFRGYALPGGGPQDRFALFAVPYDLGDVAAVRLVAEDAVGNRSERRFVDRFFARPPGSDTIRLDDRFLEKVVPDILSQTPELRPTGGLLEQYLMINGELRERNRAELVDLAGRSTEEFLWRGPFLPLKNAQAMASFAERRTYVYDGKPVDEQFHLGFDLASTARAPVQAANDGVVLKAGWYGIYGNAVILDHGYGLLSLYGHLSTVGVEPGQQVKKGEELGRTGVTGLAGGDHLHFAIILQGLPVNAREWWDDHWIQDRLRLKLASSLPG